MNWKRIGIDFREPSTWRGLVLLATSLGVLHLTTEQVDAVVAAGMAIAGLIGAFVKDRTDGS